MVIPIGRPFDIRRSGDCWVLTDPDGNEVARVPNLMIARVLSTAPAAIDAAFYGDPEHPFHERDCPKCAVRNRLRGLEVVR